MEAMEKKLQDNLSEHLKEEVERLLWRY